VYILWRDIPATKPAQVSHTLSLQLTSHISSTSQLVDVVHQCLLPDAAALSTSHLVLVMLSRVATSSDVITV